MKKPTHFHSFPLHPAVVMLLCSGIVFYRAALYLPPSDSAAAEERMDEEAVAAIEEETESKAEPESESTKETAPAESEVRKGLPAPYKLNLASQYLGDSNTSWAELLMKELIRLDANWYAGIYDMAEASPADIALRSGRARESVLGSYNPASGTHLADDPSSWVVEHFKDVRISFQSSGSSGTAVSNAQDILAMASVYAYYNESSFDELMGYVKALWKASHSSHYEMGDVYYCDGCVDSCGTYAEPKIDFELAGEDSINRGSSVHTTVYPGSESDAEASKWGDATEEETVESDLAVSESASSLAPSSSPDAPSSSLSPLEALAATADSVYVEPETTVHIIRYEETEEENAPGLSDLSASEAKAEKEGEPETEEGRSVETGESEAGKSIRMETSEASASESTKSLICPGHVDLKISASIMTLKAQDRFFALDSVGKEAKEETGWPGWTERTKAYVEHIAREDWAETYGLHIVSDGTRAPLSNTEIDSYMQLLPTDTSEVRKQIIHFALQSVGKVPYYWGGKADAKNYGNNGFGSVTSPDERGRILKGLDCSGWVAWVYWSVTENRLAYEGTDGLKSLGRQISRKELKPGDIIVVSGDTPHVVMFLNWAADGQIIAIHETGTVGNATVSVMDANWPYYRNLLD